MSGDDRGSVRHSPGSAGAIVRVVVARLGSGIGMPLALALALVAPSPSASAGSFGRGAFDFALIGDMPYTPADVQRFERLVDDVNAHRPAVGWVLHVGDLRGGRRSPCSNEVLSTRFAQMQRFRSAFVLTPGDNDYLDCRGTEPRERLAFLRRLFFPDPARTTGGRPLTVESQSARAGFAAFVENAMWTKNGVLFATFHTVTLDRVPDAHPDLTAELNAAAVAWIETVFDRARRDGSAGVFLATQADPWMVSGSPKVLRRLCRGAPGSESPCLVRRVGLDPVYPALEKAVAAFGKPVVLATGDLHHFVVDKPLLVADTLADEDPRALEHFTRVETFGSPYIHWVRISVDPRDRDVFSFHPEVIRANLLGAGSGGVAASRGDGER